MYAQSTLIISIYPELTPHFFLQCMALGRPPSLTRAYIDCELPSDEEQTLGENGEFISGCM